MTLHSLRAIGAFLFTYFMYLNWIAPVGSGNEAWQIAAIKISLLPAIGAALLAI